MGLRHPVPLCVSFCALSHSLQIYISRHISLSPSMCVILYRHGRLSMYRRTKSLSLPIYISAPCVYPSINLDFPAMRVAATQSVLRRNVLVDRDCSLRHIALRSSLIVQISCMNMNITLRSQYLYSDHSI